MKSKLLLDDFVKYCEANPNERFWQALRNWSVWSWVLVGTSHLKYDMIPKEQLKDTFYWEGRSY